MIDELLGRPSGDASVAQFPLVGLSAELLVADGDGWIALAKFFDDCKVFLLGGLSVENCHAETGNEGELLLHGVGTVHAIVRFHVVAVVPGLFDQMAAVARGVDQHVVGLRLHAALDDGFQIFIFDFEIFKG